jgi:hypothetical protein
MPHNVGNTRLTLGQHQYARSAGAGGGIRLPSHRGRSTHGLRCRPPPPQTTSVVWGGGMRWPGGKESRGKERNPAIDPVHPVRLVHLVHLAGESTPTSTGRLESLSLGSSSDTFSQSFTYREDTISRNRRHRYTCSRAERIRTGQDRPCIRRTIQGTNQRWRPLRLCVAWACR